MGTRGAFGYRLGGQDKITYNHFDSYPGGLGDGVVKALRKAVQRSPGTKRSLDELIQKVADLRVIDAKAEPTESDIAICTSAGTVDLSVGNDGTGKVNWYQLLRKAQPSEDGIWPALDVGIMLDAHAFLNDSLFCEWAYIVNLDDMLFEVYRGFQDKPHDRGRYAVVSSTALKYYPVALVKAFPLTEIDAWATTWRDDVEPPEEDEEDE